MLKPWVNIANDRITNIGFRTITHRKFKRPNGEIFEADLYSDNAKESACVVAVTKDGQVVIARQFRCGPEQMMDELPGGNIEPGEEPKNAALRELFEETGYKAGRIEHLVSHYRDGWSCQKWHNFIAYDCENAEIGQHLDPTEDIEVTTISIDQLIENAMNGHMSDAIAVLVAKDKLEAVKKRL